MYEHVIIDCKTAPGELLTPDTGTKMPCNRLPHLWQKKTHEPGYKCTRNFDGGVATFGPGAECVGFEPEPAHIWNPNTSADSERYQYCLPVSTKLPTYTKVMPYLVKYFHSLTKAKKATSKYIFPSSAIHGSMVFDTAQIMAEAKAKFANILNGEIVRNENGIIWHNFLKTSEGMAQLNRIGSSHGVIVVLDAQKHQIRIHSPHGLAEQTWLDDISKLLQDKPQDTFTIPLDPLQLQAALTGGYKSIAKKLGKDRACLDLTSEPRSIVIYGSEQDAQEAEALLGSSTQDDDSQDSLQGTCPVCFSVTDSPVLTTCNHTYCLGCFVLLCMHLGLFPKRCCALVGECYTVLTLIELQATLSSSQFEKLLTISFTKFIKRSKWLRYCPTPDCSYVYQISNEIIVCPVCSTAICTKCCTENHLGMTCETYQSELEERNKAFSAFKEANGIKDCPRCGMPIEKSEGCNHVTCQQCDSHLCWVCMESFPNATDIYEHLERGVCPFGHVRQEIMFPLFGAMDGDNQVETDSDDQETGDDQPDEDDQADEDNPENGDDQPDEDDQTDNDDQENGDDQSDEDDQADEDDQSDEDDQADDDQADKDSQLDRDNQLREDDQADKDNLMEIDEEGVDEDRDSDQEDYEQDSDEQDSDEQEEGQQGDTRQQDNEDVMDISMQDINEGGSPWNWQDVNEDPTLGVW